ncbi:MAG TPA: DUF2959 family protein [Vicinamibacteria bacterium]|nr:DUF2959 family protein [Vicinamibacteria bacterium]
MKGRKPMKDFVSKTGTLWPMLALVTAVVALPRGAGAQIFGSDPEGLKMTDSLIKKAEDVVKEAVTARGEIEKTLGSYNALFQKTDSKEIRDSYKGIEKGIERSEKQREEVRKKVDEMKVEAEAYFASWSESIEQISSDNLRKRSEERMAETRKHFDGVLNAVEQARGEYEPFISSLKDQWTYLGHDLNPSGIASLKPDAEKLNERGTALFKKIDEGMKKAGEYIDSLRSARTTTS